MRRIYFLIILFTCIALNFYGQKVPISEAETIAKNHYYIYANTFDKFKYDEISFSEYFTLVEGQEPAFYIFNLADNKGFVIVSADKRYHPIIGYSTEGNFDPENQAPSFIGYMELHKNELSYLKNKNIFANEKVKEEWRYLQQKPSLTKNKTYGVEPLLTTNWNQNCGWNAHCPEDSLGPCGRALAGCVAVAQAQIMKYWNFPEQGIGEHSYNHSTYGELSANFEETTYNWDNMPNNSPSDDIAKLLYHVGVSVNMDFGPSESAAYSTFVERSLRNFFGFSVWIDYLNIGAFNASQLYSIVIEDLEESRPLYYAGSPPVGIGHALVLDGYQYNSFNNDYYFHFNYGWSGSHNGFYRLFVGNSYFYNPNSLVRYIHPAQCGILELPFIEDFESDSHYCWTGNIYAGRWEINDSRNYTPNGNNSAHYECLYSMGCSDDVYLISPRIQLPENPDSTIVLSFMSINICPSLYGNTKNRVLISTDDGQNFTEIWEPGSVSNEWSKTVINLDEYAGEVIKIAFKRDGLVGSSFHKWYFDDIKVYVVEPEKPVVATNLIGIVTEQTAEVVGNVYEEGSAPLIAKGVVWDTHGSPDIQNNMGITNDGTGIGVFYSTITGLTEGTTYYVRTYATNDVGTSYGNTLSFTAQQDDFVCGESTITDIDGNIYNTLKFNSQCWMAENLRTSRYSDGTDIYQASCIINAMFSDWSPNEAGAFIWAGNHIHNKETYGALYNQYAVDNERNICPRGWHVPSHFEWLVLEEHLGYYKPFYAAMTGWFGYNVGSKLAGESENWYSGGELTDDKDFGKSNFNALPAGWVVSDISAQDNKDAFFWTSNNSFYKRITYNRKEIETNAGLSKSTGMSVRCIRSLLTVRTKPVVEISKDTIRIGANIFGSNFLESNEGVFSGIVWADFESPTIDNNTGKLQQQFESPNFDHYLKSLDLEKTYYFRAFVKYSDGTTSYGNEVKYRIYRTPQACPGNETVTDIDGFVYKTVLIGEQCWMAENLRVSRHSNGTTIERLCTPGDPECTGTFGALYTWETAMHGEMSGNENPSGVRGICPDGWHLPSDAEWTQLENYLIENAYNFNYVTEGNQLAKALASDQAYWSPAPSYNPKDPKPGTPGYLRNENNASGFSAFDGWSRMANGTWIQTRISSNFWTSTAKNIDNAIYRNIYYNDKALLSKSISKLTNFSVRCVKTIPSDIKSDIYKGFEIYPNPSKGIFTIEWNDNYKDSKVLIEIYNNLGNRIYFNNISISGNYIIDLSQQSEGIYYIRLTDDNKSSYQKLIKTE